MKGANMAELTLEQVRYERDEHIAIVTIDRQERLNAISNQTSRELFDVWRDFRSTMTSGSRC